MRLGFNRGENEWSNEKQTQGRARAGDINRNHGGEREIKRRRWSRKGVVEAATDLGNVTFWWRAWACIHSICGVRSRSMRIRTYQGYR